ncbi:MAG: hypothetical protein LBP33_05530 [Candidatus Adiutrix sp.]|jgi:hypothetical protein|nr:hypothetical protein [Candidatus Adiutrix sp.]
MRLFLFIFFLIAVPAALAQENAPSPAPGLGVQGPAAPALNRIFSVGDQWSLYGMPQDGRLSREAFENIVAQVRHSTFDSTVVQVVVILRDSEVGGTLGLVEKRGRRAAGLFVEEGGPGPYDVWHAVGYNSSPERIVTDCQENILAAEEVYKDLPLTFVGTVKRVSKDAAGRIFVEFSIKYQNIDLACYPWEDAPQAVDLRALRTGDRLRVSGQFTEISSQGLKLRSCLFSR